MIRRMDVNRPGKAARQKLAIWLRPAPVSDPATLAVIYSKPTRGGLEQDTSAFTSFVELSGGTATFAAVAAEAASFNDETRPRVRLPDGRMVVATPVSANYFQVLGVQ